MKKIGIVGAGQIVEDVHLPLLKSRKDVEVSWVADIDMERVKLLTRMYRIPGIATHEIERALPEVDICLIAIPLGARQEYLEASARAGKAVYVEKPFARTRAEHQYFCSLFPDYAIAVGFQRRFYKSTVLLKQIVERETFGPLDRITLNLGQYSLKSGGSHRYITNPLLSGGGTIMDLGIHALDQILFVTSPEQVSVREARAIVFNRTDYDTTILSELQRNGHRVAVECQMTRLRNLNQGFRFFFEKAVVTAGLDVGSQLCVESNCEATTAGWKQDLPGEDVICAETINQSFQLMWSFFLKGLEEAIPNLASASTSYLTTGWVEDIYRNIVND